ncbi:hypothetical protein Scep_006685 [Stephania cephalantha]|uniref:Uncharacterized protein n=1 Tax=Stephania cephalantha TaxID=152367 RepID=A0AAP0K8C1_9MAGN
MFSHVLALLLVRTPVLLRLYQFIRHNMQLEATTIGGGRRRRRRVLVNPKSRRRVGDEWRRDRWTQQWRVGDSGGGEGGTGWDDAVRGSGARRRTRPRFARWKATTMAMDSAAAVRRGVRRMKGGGLCKR